MGTTELYLLLEYFYSSDFFKNTIVSVRQSNSFFNLFIYLDRSFFILAELLLHSGCHLFLSFLHNTFYKGKSKEHNHRSLYNNKYYIDSSICNLNIVKYHFHF